MIDSGNTAWILTSTALVLLMTLPGLALFYAGLDAGGASMPSRFAPGIDNASGSPAQQPVYSSADAPLG